MFHPNSASGGPLRLPRAHASLYPVYADGGICLDIVQNNWSPIYDVSAVLTSIQSLLCDPNPNSPANSEAARMYTECRREYDKRVQARATTAGLNHPSPPLSSHAGHARRRWLSNRGRAEAPCSRLCEYLFSVAINATSSALNEVVVRYARRPPPLAPRTAVGRRSSRLLCAPLASPCCTGSCHALLLPCALRCMLVSCALGGWQISLSPAGRAQSPPAALPCCRARRGWRSERLVCTATRQSEVAVKQRRCVRVCCAARATRG